MLLALLGTSFDYSCESKIMNNKLISIALVCLAFSASSHAASFTYETNAYANSTGGGTPANPLGGLPLVLTAGEQFTVSTDPNQIWTAADTPGDPNMATLTTNANGTTSPSWIFGLPGMGSVEVGALVGNINGIYEFIGAGTNTFTAWSSGNLTLQFADVNFSDNSGTIVSDVTVPEPSSVALAGLGLLAIFAFRRKANQK